MANVYLTYNKQYHRDNSINLYYWNNYILQNILLMICPELARVDGHQMGEMTIVVLENDYTNCFELRHIVSDRGSGSTLPALRFLEPRNRNLWRYLKKIQDLLLFKYCSARRNVYKRTKRCNPLADEISMKKSDIRSENSQILNPLDRRSQSPIDRSFRREKVYCWLIKSVSNRGHDFHFSRGQCPGPPELGPRKKRVWKSIIRDSAGSWLLTRRNEGKWESVTLPPTITRRLNIQSANQFNVKFPPLQIVSYHKTSEPEIDRLKSKLHRFLIYWMSTQCHIWKILKFNCRNVAGYQHNWFHSEVKTAHLWLILIK
jgi:hypothetical protein